jgi:hypothetical protein
VGAGSGLGVRVKSVRRGPTLLGEEEEPLEGNMYGCSV